MWNECVVGSGLYSCFHITLPWGVATSTLAGMKFPTSFPSSQ